MKFKNVEKKKKEKSPSNSRTFPEAFIKIYGLSLKIFIVFIFLLAIVVIGLDLEANMQAKQAIDLERQALTTDLKFWESFVAKHQDYKDAYFQASILEYKLGDSSKAKMYVKKGLALDPNSDEGKNIEKFLNR